MKAFKIHWPRSSVGSPLDLGYKYNLPSVRCPNCGEWGNGNFEYPDFAFDLLNETEFTDRRVLDIPEFTQFGETILSAAKRPVLLVPGACLGRPYGDAFRTSLDDFVWGRIFVPQISKRARDVLAGHGINLRTADIDVRFRGKSITTHLAIQVEPVPLLTEDSLRRFTFTRCDLCGDYTRKDRGVTVPQGYYLQQARWPNREHLVMLRESLNVLASEELMDAVKKHNLAGIVFEECRQFV
jgi:hypothetical protein